jgi:CRISPR-associated protein Cmr3
MNTILLRPTDVLFFRDGRPMEGSLAGHGAAWPLPSVTNAAFLAALHRASLSGVHEHRRGLGGTYADDARRDRKFGSLLTAGPFPAHDEAGWFFPCPVDLADGSLKPSLLPLSETRPEHGSLPKPACYAVGNSAPPSKDAGAKPWLSQTAYERYLSGGDVSLKAGEARGDAEIFDAEKTIGIAIDAETGTTGQGDAAGKIYSAHYLRIRDAWRIGVFGSALDKVNGNAGERRDLLDALFSSDSQIVIGGQQRTCTVSRTANASPKLPKGIQSGFRERNGRHLVKWILLSPAVWPEISAKSRDGRDMTPHPGGWLPNWIDASSGTVLLRHRTGSVKRDYSGTKARRRADSEEPISAKLVASVVPKPIVVTGWAAPDAGADSEAERTGGACSTHLAVPAGAVYYFEADSAEDAKRLAAALNWHGSETDPRSILKRRSTLMGEKGFGLGVCGTWLFFEDVGGHPNAR